MVRSNPNGARHEIHSRPPMLLDELDQIERLDAEPVNSPPGSARPLYEARKKVFPKARGRDLPGVSNGW